MTDRFVSPAALPTPYEREVLTVLAEECAEVVQRATKTMRFGLFETQPGQPLTNRERLGHEIGNLVEMIEVAQRAGLVTAEDIGFGVLSKRANLKKYMQTSPPVPPCGKPYPGRPERCYEPNGHAGVHRAWLVPPGLGLKESGVSW